MCITACGQDSPSQYGRLSQGIFEQLLEYISSSPPAILQNVIGQVQQQEASVWVSCQVYSVCMCEEGIPLEHLAAIGMHTSRPFFLGRCCSLIVHT